MPYDAVKDFVPVSLVVVTQRVGNQSRKPCRQTTWPGVINWRRPVQWQSQLHASGSSRARDTLPARLFRLTTGAPHHPRAPYKGGGPAMTSAWWARCK